jgi:HD-GYP domain-containing protein (c-di-GMP phosphodiesterase class II)
MSPMEPPQLAALLDRSAELERAAPEERAAIEHAAVELMASLRAHHRGTADHSNRLPADCRRVGEVLGLGTGALFELEHVAILHDIGKLAVPARILDLARPLSPRERAVVCHHTVRGAEILAAVAGLAQLAPLVRASHERWDGTGYPDRLAGEAIPLAARIVFTVDAYDAMTNDRPYRRALPRVEARRRIAAGAGTAFEPRVTRALLAAL